MRLHIIDREGNHLGYITPFVGLKTRAGVISRMTQKTIWTVNGSKSENAYRAYDRLPSVYQSEAKRRPQ